MGEHISTISHAFASEEPGTVCQCGKRVMMVSGMYPDISRTKQGNPGLCVRPSPKPSPSRPTESRVRTRRWTRPAEADCDATCSVYYRGSGTGAQ